MGKDDEPPLKARLIPSTSNAATCTPQTGRGISMYLGGPTTSMMQISAHLQAEIHDTITLLHHAEDTCSLPEAFSPWCPTRASCHPWTSESPYWVHVMVPAYLKVPLLRHLFLGAMPRSGTLLGHLLRLAALPELTFHFTTDHFFQMWIWERRQKRQLWCGKWSPWNWIGGPLTFPKSFYRSRYLWWVIGTDNDTRRVWRLAPFKYLCSTKTNKWMPSICVFFAVEYVHKLYHIRVCRSSFSPPWAWSEPRSRGSWMFQTTAESFSDLRTRNFLT